MRQAACHRPTPVRVPLYQTNRYHPRCSASRQTSRSSTGVPEGQRSSPRVATKALPAQDGLVDVRAGSSLCNSFITAPSAWHRSRPSLSTGLRRSLMQWSSTSGLAETASLPNRPGVAVGADREPDLGRSVRISVALGVSGSLALALVLDRRGSVANPRESARSHGKAAERSAPRTSAGKLHGTPLAHDEWRGTVRAWRGPDQSLGLQNAGCRSRVSALPMRHQIT
jgi:hypothetical protein